MKRTYNLYRATNKENAFNHEEAWRVVKDHPKWVPTPMMDHDSPRPTKRSKTTSDSTPNTTSSDARVRIDLNEDHDEEEEDEEEAPIEEPSRPMGRDKGKRAMRGKSTVKDDVLTPVMEYVQKFGLDSEKLLSVEQEKLRIMKEKAEASKLKAEAMRAREVRKDREFYLSPHDHLTGKQLEAVLKQKAAIEEKYGW